MQPGVSMGRASLAVLCLALVFVGCDDDSPGPAPADAAATDSGGLVGLDQGGAGGMGGMGGMGGAGGETPADMGAPDQGAPLCDPAIGFGIQRAPVAVTTEAAFAPRAVWNGTVWGVTWQAAADNPAEPDLRTVHFQRFDGEGLPLGTPATLGQSRVAPHDLAWSGTRFVAAFVSARVGGVGFGGIQVQALDADGQPDGEPANLNTTFDATHLTLAYAPGATGVVVYSRGQRQAGADGLFARPLNEQGAPEGPAVTITETAVLSPNVVYGDGAFGLAWLDRDSARPLDLVFTLLSDRAQPIGDRRRRTEVGAQGQVHLAYGAGAYGIGWGQVDSMGALTLHLTLYDLNGDPLDEVALPGPEGFALVTDVSWLDPNFFAVAWQDSVGDEQTIGLTRVTPAGAASPSVRLDVVPGQPAGGAAVAGTISRAGVFFNRDPMLPESGFSDAVRLNLTTMAPCR